MINTWPGWKNVKLLGKGSFGSVYEIEKEEFGKIYKAALKVISIPADESEYKSIIALGMDDKSTREFFYESVEAVTKEFVLLNELKGYTNIVSYEDHQILERKDSFGWDILIRMELLTPLEDYRLEHTISEKDICQLGIDICKALELCRQKNILHRDIKPANIFVNKTGDYKLGDFGIARTINRTQGTLSHKGTYNYMAPEIYQGKKYGYTADIYSLGIVLYRLLNNNRLPFLEDRVTPRLLEEAMAKRMSGEKLPPLSINKELSSIIQKCIEYKPENRYQSAEELRKELEEYLRNKEKKVVKIEEPIIEEPTVVYEEETTTVIVEQKQENNIPKKKEESAIVYKVEKVKPILEAPAIEYEEAKTRIIEEPKQENKKQNSLGNPIQKEEVKKKQNSLGNIKPEEKKEEIKKEEPKPNKSKLPVIITIIALLVTSVLGYVVFNTNSNKGNTSTKESEPETEITESAVEDSSYTINGEGNILFGTYEGKKIEWIVLDEKEDGSKLLLSKYILLEKEYNEERTDVTWETCTLRNWLNSDFYQEAFSTSEQSKIQTTKVVNKDNEEYGTEGGNDTEDKVFLLSIDEANQYFNSDEERIAKELDGYTWYYWLRSPGYRADIAARVSPGGCVGEDGGRVDYGYFGVRPALWVNL